MACPIGPKVGNSNCGCCRIIKQDKLELYCKKVEGTTRGDHYQKCTRIVAGSLQTLNHMMNFRQRTKRQRGIDSFMAASRKRKRDKDIARETTGLDFDEFDVDDFNESVTLRAAVTR